MTYKYFGIDGIVLEIPQQVVDQCATSGSNDDAIANWAKILEWPDGCDERLRKHLAQYGTWSQIELADDDANKERALWNACWDIIDYPESCCE